MWAWNSGVNHKEVAQSLGVSDRVILAGYRTDIVDSYKMADCSCFHHSEKVFLLINGSNGGKLPCLALHNRGTDDLIENSQLLLASDDAQELKEKQKIAMTSDYIAEVKRKRNSEHLKTFALSNTLALVKSFYLRESKK